MTRITHCWRSRTRDLLASGRGVFVPVAGEREPGRQARTTAPGAQARGQTVRSALPHDIDAVKVIADQNRAELGFHTRQSFFESVSKGELLVAAFDGRLVGFLHFHHTRAGHATLREIATAASLRGRGIGRALILALVNAARKVGAASIRLTCPVELPANEFYRSLGFRRSHRRSKAGKYRPLYQWELPLLTARPLAFVASLTNAANDLRNLLPLWEKEGPSSGRSSTASSLRSSSSRARSLTCATCGRNGASPSGSIRVASSSSRAKSATRISSPGS